MSARPELSNVRKALTERLTRIPVVDHTKIHYYRDTATLADPVLHWVVVKSDDTE